MGGLVNKLITQLESVSGELDNLRDSAREALDAYEEFTACDGGSSKAASALVALREPMRKLREVLD
jgi:hypothetical protein